MKNLSQVDSSVHTKVDYAVILRRPALHGGRPDKWRGATVVSVFLMTSGWSDGNPGTERFGSTFHPSAFWFPFSRAECYVR